MKRTGTRLYKKGYSFVIAWVFICLFMGYQMFPAIGFQWLVINLFFFVGQV